VFVFVKSFVQDSLTPECLKQFGCLQLVNKKEYFLIIYRSRKTPVCMGHSNFDLSDERSSMFKTGSGSMVPVKSGIQLQRSDRLPSRRPDYTQHSKHILLG
jgi:hypothetical protein